MSKPKLTGWFGPESRPGRHGPYQTNHRKDDLKLPKQGYQYWNGRFWGCFELSPESAVAYANYPSGFQNNYWRGLAHPPKAKP